MNASYKVSVCRGYRREEEGYPPSWTLLYNVHKKLAFWEWVLLLCLGPDALTQTTALLPSPFSTWGQFRSQLLWGWEAGKLLPNPPIITGQLTHICWQRFLPLILGNILRFCGQHLLNNDPVHFRFYWFHLLYIFQKFLSVLVSWWNSSWFSSIAKDIFILLCSVISKRFWEGVER